MSERVSDHALRAAIERLEHGLEDMLPKTFRLALLREVEEARRREARLIAECDHRLYVHPPDGPPRCVRCAAPLSPPAEGGEG